MQLRTSNLAKIRDSELDILVVGGGINGAVSAAALAARGARVGLIDKRDFAGFTSQQSSNLAWGGIKYLESYEFGLVRKLCLSRNALMKNYPSTVREIRFLTTLSRGSRYPPWVMYFGTLLYWLMGNCFTRPPRLLSPKAIGEAEPIINRDRAIGGFEYSDAYLYDNDARFVFNFVRSAMKSGALALNYVESEGARRQGNYWQVTAKDGLTGETFPIRTKVLINACGPFVDEHNLLSGQVSSHRHVFSKGIHLIVDRVTPEKRVLTFFADDGRLFFVIPMGARTCIGTTDTRTESPYAEVSAEDRKFVLDNINARLNLARPLSAGDVVAERCGVRPLVVGHEGGDDVNWLNLSRRHAVEVNRAERHISIYGGKLTDCLNVGEEITERVAELGIPLPHAGTKWFGEPDARVRDEFFRRAAAAGLDQRTPASSPEALSARLWRRYGADAFDLLEQIHSDPAQAELIMAPADYLRCEIAHVARWEMVTKLEDFLRRRSKIELVLRREQISDSAGLKEVCRVLFGDAADEKLGEYLASEGCRLELK